MRAEPISEACCTGRQGNFLDDVRPDGIGVAHHHALVGVAEAGRLRRTCLEGCTECAQRRHRRLQLRLLHADLDMPAFVEQIAGKGLELQTSAVEVELRAGPCRIDRGGRA